MKGARLIHEVRERVLSVVVALDGHAREVDRHVAAAAIHSGASLIVTFNLKDFPADALKPYNLAAQHPDDFIVDLLDLHPASVLEAAASHRRSLKNPPKTVDEYLDTLLAQGLTQSVAVMRQWTVAM